jgi:hypothetical protein
VGTQAVHRVVGDRDCFIQGFIGNDAQHRAKYFLLSDAHGARHLREHRRAGIKTLLKARHAPGPAAQQFRAFVEACLDHGLHALELRFVGDRAQLRCF